jgi:hypothetical protein
MSTKATIKCPNCQTNIDINKILYHQLEEEFQKATQKQLKIEKQRLQEELKREILEEQSKSMALLEKELKEKSEQVKELNETKAQIAKLQREKEEIASKAKLEAQLALDEELKLEKAK